MPSSRHADLAPWRSEWSASTKLVVAIAALALMAPLMAQAHFSELTTVSLKASVGDADSPSTYNVAVVCTDAVLVYGLSLFIPHNDPEDRYAVYADSMRLGTAVLNHVRDPAEIGRESVNLLGGQGSLAHPLLVPKYSPLVIPIRVLDGAPGLPAEAVLDITYGGNPDALCRTGDLLGPQKIGLLVRASVERGADRMAAAEMSVRDYNSYLQSVGEQWSLELVVKDAGSEAETALERVKEFASDGINLIVGPSSSDSIAHMWEYTDRNDMLVMSCCSTAPSLALPDHVFRTTPDDTHQSKALARVIVDDGIKSVVIVHRDNQYGQELAKELAAEIEKRGGAVAAGIPYPADTKDFDGIAQDAAEAIQNMTDVAVVAISSTEMASLIESAMGHEMLDDVRWYGSESVVNHRGISHGELGAFSEKVGLTGVIVAAPSNPIKNDVEQRLVTELDLRPGESPSTFLYSMYDAILILAKAMLATQSTDAERLIEAIPHVSTRTHGAMLGTLDENGDLAPSNYGVWKIIDMAWTRTGTFVEDADTVLPHVP